MDGTTIGIIIVRIILTYIVGRATWRKTGSPAKTTIITIVSLMLSPLIAWIVYEFLSPAEHPVGQVSTVTKDVIESDQNGTGEPNSTGISEVSTGVFTEDTIDEPGLSDSDLDGTSDPVNDSITENENILNEGNCAELPESEPKATEIEEDKREIGQDPVIEEKAAVVSVLKPAVYCRFCGAKLNDNAQFCHKCGKKVEQVL